MAGIVGDSESTRSSSYSPDRTRNGAGPEGNSADAESTDLTLARFSHHKNTFFCNVAFFLLFSSFIGLAIVQSTLFGQVGVVGLGVLFLATVISCIALAPVGATVLGCKITMCVCFVGFIVWEISHFYPHWATTIPAAVCCGAANGAIWAAQSTYYTRISIGYAKLIQDRVDMVIARSFGTFFCFLLLGTSFGCLVTSAILSTDPSVDPSAAPTTEAPGGPMEHCGSAFCLKDHASGDDSENGHDVPDIGSYSVLLTEGMRSSELSHRNVKDGTSDSEPSQDQVYLLVGVHTASTVMGLVLLVAFVDSQPRENFEGSRSRQALLSVEKTLRQFKRRRQLLLIPLNVYTGLSKSFMLADITQAYIGCALGVDMIGYCSITYGITAFLASLTCGLLIRVTGRVPIYTFAYIMALAMCIMLLIWVPDSTKVYVFYLIPALWAIADAIFISQMNATYGYMFADNAQGAFATFRFCEGIGLVLGYIFNLTICVSHKLYILLALATVGILGYYCAEYTQRKYEIGLSEGIQELSLEGRQHSHSSSQLPGSEIGAYSREGQLGDSSSNHRVNTSSLATMFYIAVPRKYAQGDRDGENIGEYDWTDYYTTSIFETSV